MFRPFFIWLSKNKSAQFIIMNWKIAWTMASRFIAGTTSEQAISAAKLLNKRGFRVSLDILGEKTIDRESALKSVDEILKLLDDIQISGIKANVSIKLSQIGLTLDPVFCQENLERILSRCCDYANFIRIDMEESTVTGQTINILQSVLEHGFTPFQVGIVIQAYLYRSIDDIRGLIEKGVRVRLCKGAYLEPADVAFPKKADVDVNYDLLVELLLKSANFPGNRSSENGVIPPLPALATHDLHRIENVIKMVESLGVDKSAFEFQMLYGIRRDLQESLLEKGYAVRLYVPFGTQWYPYFMRRLAERPENIWFFVSNFFRR
jgi:proline dehydrogenase